MNEKDIIELYRNQVESRLESPPEICWDEINSQLDIEDTWNSISVELNRVLPLKNEFQSVSSGKNQLTFTKLLSIISPLVFTLLLLLYDTRETNLIQPEQSGIDLSVVSVHQLTVPEIGDAEPIISGHKAGETKIVSNVMPAQQTEKSEPNSLFSEPLPINEGETVTKVVSIKLNQENKLTPVRIYPIDLTIPLAERKLNSVIPSNFYKGKLVLPPFVLISPPEKSLVSGYGKDEDSESSVNTQILPGRTLKMGKFAVGISLTEKNTWLISQETFDGLGRQKLNTTKANFINDFGIILRYTQSERWSFEGSCFLLSKTGQSYRQYLYGIYSSKSYELRYFSYEMSVRYSANSLLNLKNVKFNYIAGTYISHLNSAIKSIDYSMYDVSSDYNPIDYGVIMGYELELSILDRFAVAPGFRIKYGIPNIFADKPGIPKELHTTRNASLEFRLNLTIPFSKF
jgi:hypothetical protein